MLTSRFHAHRADRLAFDGNLCSFGITELAVAGLVSAGLEAGTAATLAGGLVGAGEFAAGGAALAGVTGGDPGLGALTGAITGGIGGLGLGAGLGEAAGIGTTAGNALVATGSGALAGGITGQDPLKTGLTAGAGSLLLSGAGELFNGGGAAGTSPGADTTAANLSTGATPAGAVSASPDAISLASTPATGIGGASGAASPAPAGVTAALGAQPFDLTSLSPTGAGGAGDLASSVGIGGPVGSGGAPSGLPSPGGGPAAPSADASALAGGGSGAGALDPIAASNLGGENLFGPGVSGGTTPVAPAAGAAAGAAKPGFLASGLQDLGVGSGTADLISKGVGPAIAAGGLGYSLLSQPASGVSSSQATGDAASLQKNADTLAAAGTANQGYLNSGTLPAGAQAAVNSASNAAKAKLRSDYARLGLTGSTMEGQALANIDQQAASQVFSIGNQLVNTGLTQTQLADSLYQQLIGLNTAQNASTQTAIAGLAQALSGTSGTTIKLAA